MVSLRTTSLLAAALPFLCTLGGCDWLWPLEGEFDPHRCDPACAAGSRCLGGRCVSEVDASKKPRDGAVADRGAVTGDVTSGELGSTADLLPPPDSDLNCSFGASCVDAQTIKHCNNGKWKIIACASVCTIGGYDYTNGCKVISGAAKCECGKWIPYSGGCGKGLVCGPSHKCISVTGSASKFCSRYCNKDIDCIGGPAGSLGLCTLVESGTLKKMCGFKCDSKHVCPPALGCNKTLAICVPGLPPG